MYLLVVRKPGTNQIMLHRLSNYMKVIQANNYTFAVVNGVNVEDTCTLSAGHTWLVLLQSLNLNNYVVISMKPLLITDYNISNSHHHLD